MARAPTSNQAHEMLQSLPAGGFKVLRLDLPLDAATFDLAIAAQPAISLSVQPAHGTQDAVWEAFLSAHLYHVSSAKDDLPRHWFASSPLLDRCPKLLAVSSYGAGYDTVDVHACTQRGVCVMNQAGSNAGAVAEHTMGLILGLSKRIGESDRRLRRGEHFERGDAMGFDLQGRTLGLVGIGHAGRRVVELARAFGMLVLACDPWVAPEEITRRGARAVSLEQLLQNADVVSLHCPLDASTAGLIGASAFASMKPGALFISTARGTVHDEAALFQALASGHLGGAGLDVWAVEPPAMDHPLLGLDNVIATHHTAGVTHDSRRQMASMAARQIIAVSSGARPDRLVNPEVWPAYVERFERVLGRKTLSLE